MKQKYKIVVAIVLLACGTGLIGWSMRDPDAGFYEQPKVKKAVTLQDTPPAVRATIDGVTKSGGKIEDIYEERRGEELKYEVDVIAGATKIEYQIGPDGAILKQKTKKVKAK
jgi:hypothetical protein